MVRMAMRRDEARGDDTVPSPKVPGKTVGREMEFLVQLQRPQAKHKQEVG